MGRSKTPFNLLLQFYSYFTKIKNKIDVSYKNVQYCCVVHQIHLNSDSALNFIFFQLFVGGLVICVCLSIVVSGVQHYIVLCLCLVNENQICHI